jgi:RHS repeat-associated protein
MGLTNGLKATSGSAPSDTVISTYAYTLDGVGNRIDVDVDEPVALSYSDQTSNYHYDVGNILTDINVRSTFHYDDNGNLTSSGSLWNSTYYTYDPLNRLIEVTTHTRHYDRVEQYIYNGLGHRVGKIEDGVQTNYLIDPNGVLPQVLAEMDENNNLIAFYVYDGAGLVAKVTPASEYYFYHYDGVGSTVAITDSSAQIVNAYAYSPYGLVGAQETITNPFTYVGRFGVMAESHGLYYMRARYYDPEVGRFINKDPIGYAGGMNLFGYVGGNPVNFIDPWGLFTIVVSDPGGRNGPTYGATITVTSDSGQTVTVAGSSWPNPNNPSPGVASGTYDAIYSPTGHHGISPGVRLENGNAIPTLGPNPAQNNQPFATGINMHAAFSPTCRGSAGCITIDPDQASLVWGILQPGETGTITIVRPDDRADNTCE